MLRTDRVKKNLKRTCKRESVFQRESVKTDYSGGFTDTMKAVDVELTEYYKGGQVEILVTDNGTATVVIYPKSGDTEAVQIQLDYSRDKAKVTDDDNNSINVSVSVDKPEFDKLADGIIQLVDKQLEKIQKSKGKKESVRKDSVRFWRSIRKNENLIPMFPDIKELTDSVVSEFNAQCTRNSSYRRFSAKADVRSRTSATITVMSNASGRKSPYIKFLISTSRNAIVILYADTGEFAYSYKLVETDTYEDVSVSIASDLRTTL